MSTRTWSLAPSLLTLAACGAAPVPDDSDLLLQVVAWKQTAAEHDALCLQVFAAASAAVQAAQKGARPQAVIVDVDETMLDNAPYEARLVLDRQAFAAETWNAWCREARAPAIPGALAFAQACQARGVTVVYVTNRAAELEGATRANLQAIGFPLADGEGVDVVLCKGEVDGESGKAGRRARVEERFDVVALVGDDLHDFLDAEASVVARRQAVQQHAADWGRTWFMLPNPMYGSWERAVSRGAGDTSADKQAVLSPLR